MDMEDFLTEDDPFRAPWTDVAEAADTRSDGVVAAVAEAAEAADAPVGVVVAAKVGNKTDGLIEAMTPGEQTIPVANDPDASSVETGVSSEERISSTPEVAADCRRNSDAAVSRSQPSLVTLIDPPVRGSSRGRRPGRGSLSSARNATGFSHRGLKPLIRGQVNRGSLLRPLAAPGRVVVHKRAEASASPSPVQASEGSASAPSRETFAYQRSCEPKRYLTKQFGLLELPAFSVRGPACVLMSEATNAIEILLFNRGKVFQKVCSFLYLLMALIQNFVK